MLALRCRMRISCRAHMCGRHVFFVKGLSGRALRARRSTRAACQKTPSWGATWTCLSWRSAAATSAAPRSRAWSRAPPALRLTARSTLSDLSKPIDEENLKARQSLHCTQRRVVGGTRSLFAIIPFARCHSAVLAGNSTAGWGMSTCMLRIQWVGSLGSLGELAGFLSMPGVDHVDVRSQDTRDEYSGSP